MVTPRSTATWPSSGSSSPVIIRNSVVLPAPLGPTKPTFSPRLSAADASMNRICRPFCLPILSRRIIRDARGRESVALLLPLGDERRAGGDPLLNFGAVCHLVYLD